MGTELKLKIKVEFKDFLNFQYWVNRKRFTRMFIYVLFLILLLLILPIITTGSFDLSFFSSATFTPFIILVILPFFMWVTIYFNSKRSFDNDLILQKEQNFVFNSDGLTCINENSTTIIKWNELFKQAESSKNILIYCSPVKAFIIPKRLLSEIELLDLNMFLASHVVSREKKTFFKLEWVVPVSIIVISIIIGVISGLYDSTNASNFYNEGNTKAKNADFKGAIIDLDKAIKENPSYSMAYACRGYAKEMLHNYSEAIADCNKAIEFDEKNYWAYYYIGYAKYESGDSTGGCEAYNKAASLGSKESKEIIEHSCK